MNRILKHFFLKLIILSSDSVRFLLYFLAPGAGPELPSSAQVNKTTFNISWEHLLREKSYGKVILYEVKATFLKKGNLRKRSVIYSPVNTSVTFVVLSDLELCSKYNVSVRAYTVEGPGPYGEPLELETSSEFDEIIMKTILVCDMIGEKKNTKKKHFVLFYDY